MPLVPPGPRRAPTQQRAQELVRAVREAAHEILAGAGPDALTTRRIAERAGVSVGSLYYYFPNKEAVVTAVFDAVLEQIEDEITELKTIQRPEDEPLEQAIAALVRRSFHMTQRFARVHEAFFRDHVGRYDLAGRISGDGRSHFEETVEWLTTVLERRRERLAITDPARAARVAVMLLQGARRAAIELGSCLPDEAYEHEVSRALVAYLLEGERVRIDGT